MFKIWRFLCLTFFINIYAWPAYYKLNSLIILCLGNVLPHVRKTYMEIVNTGRQLILLLTRIHQCSFFTDSITKYSNRFSCSFSYKHIYCNLFVGIPWIMIFQHVGLGWRHQSYAFYSWCKYNRRCGLK